MDGDMDGWLDGDGWQEGGCIEQDGEMKREKEGKKNGERSIKRRVDQSKMEERRGGKECRL